MLSTGSRVWGLQQFWRAGFVSAQHVESSQTRNQTFVPALASRFLITGTPGKSLLHTFRSALWSSQNECPCLIGELILHCPPPPWSLSMVNGLAQNKVYMTLICSWIQELIKYLLCAGHSSGCGGTQRWTRGMRSLISWIHTAFDCVDHNKLWKILKSWEYQTTWPASWETCMQVRKQQFKLDREQQTGSK